MKAQQLRTIATVLNATVADRRKITSLVTGIRHYLEQLNTLDSGTEKEELAKLTSAVTLATTYNADRAFIQTLNYHMKALKSALKAQITTVRFDEFKLPYTYVKGTVRHQSINYSFLCYMRAPSLANEARAIDPTFESSVAPTLKTELREIVKAALTVEWNRHRFNALNLKAA